VPSRPLWTVDDAARYLQVSSRTIRRRIADRTLPVVRLGRVVRLHPDDVVEALEGRRS
jgi:excisionase family DNA binding protein